MKRMLCLLLALALLTGCVPQGLSRREIGVQFYYISKNPDYFSPTGILGSEERILNEEQNSVADLMDRYLSGPISQELSNPFPQGLRMISAEEAEQEFSPKEITLVLDDTLTDLSGIRLQLACACIARTLYDYGGYETVNIRAETLPLEGDRELISMQPAKLVLEDHRAGQPNALVTLYFADSNGRYLIGEQRSVPGEDNDNLPEFIVRNLIEGPQSDTLSPTIPEGTMLLNVSRVDRVCMVSFSEEFLSNRPKTAQEERMTVFSLVNSLTQLDGVDSVEIMVQNRKVDKYLHMDLSGGLTSDDRLTGPVRSGVGEFDATLYVCLEGSEQLAAFPMRIRESVDVNLVRPVLNELCVFQAGNGYYSPANGLVKAWELQEENGTLAVMLTTESADDAELRMLARSVIATLRELLRERRLKLFINDIEYDQNADPYSQDWILP